MIIQDYMRNSLKSEINQLITRSGIVSITNAEKGNPTEPELTLELAKEIAYGLYNSLSLFIKEYNFCVHAIFCHQCPKVIFDYPRTSKKESCELGDLLFVYDEKEQAQGNALLLQAKKARGLKYRTYGKERIQLDLYKNWYAFNYQNTAFSTETRKIKLPDLTAAQYLLMFPPFDNSSQYRCILPGNIENTSLAYTDLFSENLVDLLTYEKGGKYDVTLSKNSTDWSAQIHDLLKINEVLECSNIIYKHRDFSKKEYYLQEFIDSKIFGKTSGDKYIHSCFDNSELYEFISQNNKSNKFYDIGKKESSFLIFHISSIKNDKESFNAKM